MRVPILPDIRGLNLKNGQQEDDDITTIRKWIEERKTPMEEDLKEKPTRLKRLAAILYKLEIQDDTLVVRKQDIELEVDDYRIVVPLNMENILVKLVHEELGLHQGVFKTTTRLLRHFYLPTPTAVVRSVITKCLRCNRKAKHVASTVKPHNEQVNSFMATRPLQALHIDHWGPMNPRDGKYRACLTARDSYTNFVWINPVTDLTAKQVVNVLEMKIFSVFGSPEVLVSDNHASFKNDQMTSLCQRWGVRHSFISAYNSAANGKIERLHRDLGATIRATISAELKWAGMLHLIQLALNTSVCSTKKFSPYYLMYYRVPPITRGLVGPTKADRPSEDEYVDDISDRFKRAFKIVETNTKRRIEYRELTYKEASSFKPGDRVLVFMHKRTKGVSSKLLPAYSLPFVVKEALSWSVYRLESESWSESKITLIRSATFLKKYNNDEEIDYGGRAKFTEQDFGGNNHDFEEIVEEENPSQSYNLRHTTKSGQTFESTPGGKTIRNCELDDLINSDIEASSDEEMIGFDPGSETWVPQVPRLKKGKFKERVHQNTQSK